MNKEEIIVKVQSLNLPKGSYVVYGGAPLAIAGIREANDIDLLVSEDVFGELKTRGWKEIYKGSNDTPLTCDDFEAHDNWNFSSYSPTLKDLLSRADEIGEVMFASIEDVRKWKEVSGIEKHKNDIKLINDYLKKQK